MLISNNFNKYKSIIISVVVFILLDISVLVFSFYISFQISEDAVQINLAGQQTTLSQRITKNLLEFERAYHKARNYSSIVNDIEESMQIFDTTLKAFDVGGSALIDDRVVVVEPITDPKGREAIETAKPMWQIYKNYTADVLNEFKGREHVDEDLVTIFFRESILKDVVLYTTHNNIDLLDVMTDLTESVERVASEKTRKLRFFQLCAIILAVVNFFFILFFSIRKLVKTDGDLEFANAELDVMFNTIEEGIFLLDKQFYISDQYSKQMNIIFNEIPIAGESFSAMLKDICSDFNEEGVNDFLVMLFDANKNMKVLNVLNPLQKVLVRVENQESVFDDKKYLQFVFSRIITDGGVDRVLVRVTDISSAVLQEQVVEEQRNKQFKQLRLMSVLMNSNADILPVFFQRSFYCFDNISSVLKTPVNQPKEYFEKVERIDSLLTDFKDEARRLEFETLLEVADDLQHELEKLKVKSVLEDKDFIDISSVLEHLVSHTESVYKFSNKILAEASVKAANNCVLGDIAADYDWDHLNLFSQEVAGKKGCEVDVKISGLGDTLLPKKVMRYLNSILIQLIYCLIIIGLDEPRLRQKAKKSPVGKIDIRFSKKKNSGYYLTVRDDGQGLDVDELMALSAVNGVIIDASSETVSKQQLLWLTLSAYSSQPQSSSIPLGEIIDADQLMEFVSQSGVRFDIKTVAGAGSVFEFFLPSSIEDIC